MRITTFIVYLDSFENIYFLVIRYLHFFNFKQKEKMLQPLTLCITWSIKQRHWVLSISFKCKKRLVYFIIFTRNDCNLASDIKRSNETTLFDVVSFCIPTHKTSYV